VTVLRSYHRLLNDTCAMSGNVKVAVALIGVMTLCASIPYTVRSMQTENTLSKKGKLTGSQRQRGMYMNGGSQDAGPDPDYVKKLDALRAAREAQNRK
jgi:hypothetical protein